MPGTAQCLLIFLLVLSPLYIPVAVTVAAAIGDRRNAIRRRWRATVPRSDRVASAEERTPPPGSGDRSAVPPRHHLDPVLTNSDAEAA